MRDASSCAPVPELSPSLLVLLALYFVDWQGQKELEKMAIRSSLPAVIKSLGCCHLSNKPTLPTPTHTYRQVKHHDFVAPTSRMARRSHQNSRSGFGRTPLFHPPVIMLATSAAESHDAVRAPEARGQEPPRGQKALPLAEKWRCVAWACRQEPQHGASQHCANVETPCEHHYRPELCSTHS